MRLVWELVWDMGEAVMVGKLSRVMLLVTILTGLCSSAHANTTAVFAAQLGSSGAGTAPRVYNIAPPVTDSAAPATSAPASAPAPTPSPIPAPAPAPAPSAEGRPGSAVGSIRVALLLPLGSETLARAANAVRNGFQAAYQTDRKNLTINVIETGDAPADILTAYADASANYDIVVGPLTRSGTTAIAQRGVVTKPTVALAQAESVNDVETVLPPNMLAIGLSAEDEARQTATFLGNDLSMSNAFVVSGSATWQKRAARAFSTQWIRIGRKAQTMELSVSDGNVSASGLLQLRKRLQAEKPSLLFVALDAAQALQLRSAIGTEIPVFGTSQLNPLTLDSREPMDTGTEMNGIRFLDIPWQLQADHPAVMIYPRTVVAADQKRSADLERLYALGIDAYRVVLELAARRADFEIDGVTGRLVVSFGNGRSRFERFSQGAMYQNGIVVPVLDGR